MALVALRLQQPLGDARTQAAHRHALLGAVAQVGGERRLDSGQAPWPAARQSAPARAPAAGLAGVASAPSTSPLVTRPSLPVPAHRAGGERVVGHQLGGSGHRNAALASWRSRRGRRCCSSGRRGCRCRSGRACGGRHALGVDGRDHFFADAALTVVLDQLGHHAVGRRRHFEHDLVGFDLDQDLVHRHGLAGLLLPGQQGGLGHRFGQLRNFDFYDCH